MKQALGEDDGGYSSKNRFDRPFHAANSRCADVVFDRVVAQNAAAGLSDVTRFEHARKTTCLFPRAIACLLRQSKCRKPY
jgi:hypothetical protein